jgi:hypothetical protein
MKDGGEPFIASNAGDMKKGELSEDDTTVGERSVRL